MLPDIEPEQRVIVSCLARNIDKGDIVALYPDYFNLESEGSIVFRRVIAAEGDRLTLDWDMETLLIGIINCSSWWLKEVK